jgi:hypothetical protein
MNTVGSKKEKKCDRSPMVVISIGRFNKPGGSKKEKKKCD